MDYTISIDTVVDMFLYMAGDGSLNDGKVFCRTAADTVNSWLDPKKELAPHDREICYAAACIAFYRYTLKASCGCDTVKAGDITVTDGSENTVAYAKALMSDAVQAVSALFKPRRFAFLGTEV